eukprot:GHVH01013028.1.p1 GENE.GHVH01013028.1~~GHVH01013028.1.p1  ORF type:complete len:128 (+),score=9.81 GHVH01013028.1:139-522(+)
MFTTIVSIAFVLLTTSSADRVENLESCDHVILPADQGPDMPRVKLDHDTFFWWVLVVGTLRSILIVPKVYYWISFLAMKTPLESQTLPPRSVCNICWTCGQLMTWNNWSSLTIAKSVGTMMFEFRIL